jgi:hypothetical protein
VKKIIDLAQIEARERELEDELSRLRAIKKYATKFGTDYGQPQSNGAVASEAQPAEASSGVMQVLRSLFATFGANEFNYQKIAQALAQTEYRFSRSSIFDALAEFKERGEIQTVHAGAGRRPAQLKTTEKFTPF